MEWSGPGVLIICIVGSIFERTTHTWLLTCWQHAFYLFTSMFFMITLDRAGILCLWGLDRADTSLWGLDRAGIIWGLDRAGVGARSSGPLHQAFLPYCTDHSISYIIIIDILNRDFSLESAGLRKPFCNHSSFLLFILRKAHLYIQYIYKYKIQVLTV